MATLAWAVPGLLLCQGTCLSVQACHMCCYYTSSLHTSQPNAVVVPFLAPLFSALTVSRILAVSTTKITSFALCVIELSEIWGRLRQRDDDVLHYCCCPFEGCQGD